MNRLIVFLLICILYSCKNDNNSTTRIVRCASVFIRTNLSTDNRLEIEGTTVRILRIQKVKNTSNRYSIYRDTLVNVNTRELLDDIYSIDLRRTTTINYNERDVQIDVTYQAPPSVTRPKKRAEEEEAAIKKRVVEQSFQLMVPLSTNEFIDTLSWNEMCETIRWHFLDSSYVHKEKKHVKPSTLEYLLKERDKSQ